LQINNITLSGQRIKFTGWVHVFPLPLLVFFSWKFFKVPHKKPTCESSLAALIGALKVAFHFGLQNKFPEKKIKTRTRKWKTWSLPVL
jgi:hypothetical protein